MIVLHTIGGGSNPSWGTKGRVEQLVGSADCKSVAKALGVRVPPLPQQIDGCPEMAEGSGLLIRREFSPPWVRIPPHQLIFSELSDIY